MLPHALVMPNSARFDGTLAELRKQGLDVSVHNEANEIFYIKADGIFVRYIVTGTEWLELKIQIISTFQAFRPLASIIGRKKIDAHVTQTFARSHPHQAYRATGNHEGGLIIPDTARKNHEKVKS